MRVLVLAFLACCSVIQAKSVLAQTGVSTLVAVTPADTSTCSPSYYTANSTSDPGYVPNTHEGYCKVPVTWHAAMPGPLYAISCTPETGTYKGYLLHPQILGLTRSASGFTLGINFIKYAGYTLADLGTMYVDCVASNQ